MGGGPVLKSVAKLFSWGGTAPAARTASSHFPPDLPNVATAVLSSFPGAACSASASSFGPAGGGAAVPSFLSQFEGCESCMQEREDEWMFAGDEELQEFRVGGVSSPFVDPPTRREVRVATRELEHAFRSGIFSAPGSSALRSSEIPQFRGGNSIPWEGLTSEGRSVFAAESSRHQYGASESSENERQIYHSNETMAHFGYMERFRLLICNPSVQGVIMALAEDKAVWDAVHKNDTVKMFLSQFQESNGISAANAGSVLPERQIQIISRFSNDGKVGLKLFGGEESESSCESLLGGSSFLSNLLDETKHTLFKFTEVLVNFIKNMIYYVEKEFLNEDDTSAIEKAMKPCVALAVIVVSMVLVKRVAFS